MSGTKLYTPELLALATGLAEWPPLADADRVGEARSPTCGSTIRCTLALDPSGRIAAIGLRAHACAVGQASAALFARHAEGRDQDEITQSLAELHAWLSGAASLPSWPELASLAAARDFPARHGAIMLPWKAAIAALSSPPHAR